MDYRLLCIVALVAWGLWSFLSKIATKTSSDHNVAFWTTLAGFLPIVAYSLTARTRSEMRPSVLPVVAGVLAGIATVAFYLALRRGPASVVVPLSGMYILLPAVLGFIILKEPLTVTHVLGLGFAGLAVLFLSL